MDIAIKEHFHEGIKEKIPLTGGYSFETWLLTLQNGQKVVFRTAPDSEISGGKKIIVSEIFKREKFFYDNLNRREHICPVVYVIDDSYKYYDKPYQISEFIEGTPLNLCFDNFDREVKNNIYYKIGQITAKINNLELDKNHDYISQRDSWEEFITSRLIERLIPLMKDKLITFEEIDKITNSLRRRKAQRTLSFLHLDMRFPNMIYNNGEIFILDAENCEFGDPLYELAIIEITGHLTESFLKGYKSIYGNQVNLDDDLFYYYKMERQAALVNLFMNIIKKDEKSTERCLENFQILKFKLLELSS
jgi:aminoglycoside phosphotransferase (APT) family kinase protein